MKKNKDKVEESNRLKEQLARALADYDNLRKRVDKEKETWFKFAAERIVIKLLAIYDILESAQNHLQDQGLAIAISELIKIFEEEGLEQIKTDDKFNEESHEAIESVEGGEEGKIAEVLQSGWKFKDGPVVRHAKVKVFAKIKK